ncbi:dTDP-4-amino-4,6-dideoxygalactose transaminase [candidate division WOR-3 bacterium]|nr:dTDP-4-amino-4,6-dideoxygalactose transaminase [candidate division WOR-3 bacterium]
MDIVFSKPFWGKEEKEIIWGALQSGKGTGNGPFCQKVQKRIEELFGIKHALLTTSCTHAIELSMMVLDIKAGDEVICPSFTFVSTANAIVQQGATPIFAEIKEETLNINPDDIRKKITRRTKAIVPVHYAGIGCEMDKIIAIARENNLFIVEDAAQGVGAKYKNSYLGTIGDIGCYSFHETKNITCGEGGAFLTNNDAFAKRAEIIYEKGTNRSAFLRGEISKYTWVNKGSSYVLSDILAAILNTQFDKITLINRERKRIFDTYICGLKPLEKMGVIKLPKIPDYATPNYHIFYFLLQDEKERDRCLYELNKRGIKATFHYIPLHSSPYGQKLGYKLGDLSITEHISKSLVRLPIYPDLTEEAVNYIIEAVIDILNR